MEDSSERRADDVPRSGIFATPARAGTPAYILTRTAGIADPLEPRSFSSPVSL
jgi:hypothetical protein